MRRRNDRIKQIYKELREMVLNRDDYIKKLFDIISGTSNFKKLSADQTLLRKGQLQPFLRKLKNKQFFKQDV